MNSKEIIRDFSTVNLGLLQKHIVDPISDDELRSLVSAFLLDVNKVTFALTDVDTNDRQQVISILQGFVSNPLITFGELELIDALNGLRNEVLKQLLVLIVPSISQTLRLLTDGDKDNNEEIDAVWRTFLSDPRLYQILLQLLLGVIQNRK